LKSGHNPAKSGQAVICASRDRLFCLKHLFFKGFDQTSHNPARSGHRFFCNTPQAPPPADSPKLRKGFIWCDRSAAGCTVFITAKNNGKRVVRQSQKEQYLDCERHTVSFLI